jgi:hypothetical protein
MQICWAEVLSWYWRWETNFKHIGATKDGFWSYEYWSWTLILTRFTQLMDQLKELGFCTLHAVVTLKCVGLSMGEKQPLTKKLPATTTVSTCWYSIAILIYRVVVCILLGGFSRILQCNDRGTWFPDFYSSYLLATTDMLIWLLGTSKSCGP